MSRFVLILFAEEVVGDYYGFVITGSCSDTNGDVPWVCQLLSLLQKLIAMNRKILGICFGLQLLGRALGGRIDHSATGWDMGITKVNLHASRVLQSSLNLPASLSIVECHMDEVCELPPEAEILACSNKTRIEMFVYGDHVLGIQGHPEYNKDILLHLVDRLFNRNIIEESFRKEVKAKLEIGEPDAEAWKQLDLLRFSERATLSNKRPAGSGRPPLGARHVVRPRAAFWEPPSGAQELNDEHGGIFM